MSILDEYQKLQQQSAGRVLAEALAGNLQRTTVHDLRELVAHKPELGPVTLAELYRLTADTEPSKKKEEPPKVFASPPEIRTASAVGVHASEKPIVAKPKPQTVAFDEDPDPQEWDTRTEEGREQIDQAVLGILKRGSPLLSENIRAHVGGTPLQVRASLNRLIESGSVTVEGKARGTRYARV